MAIGKTYPVKLNRKYDGPRDKADDHNRIAEAVESWINDRTKPLTPGETKEFGTHEIARALNATGIWKLTAEDVSEVLDFDNGITVTR
jgi:hypothetical protein